MTKPKALLSTLLFVLPLTARSAPPAGGEWVPIPELTDEFEGKALDAGRWYDHDPDWQGRQPGLFVPGNVSVRDGALHLTARVEEGAKFPSGYHTFTTASVTSKALVRYGYFEVKARPMRSRIASGFWLSHHTAAEWTEIDVFEICGGRGSLCGDIDHMHVHVFQTPASSEHWKRGRAWRAPENLTARDHVYGLDWNADAITWYVDGTAVWKVANTHWHQPLRLHFDAETRPDWFGMPRRDELPSTYTIEYVRAWKRREVPAAPEAGPRAGRG